jgi:hypothetical protein
MFETSPAPPVEGPARDGVTALADGDDSPAVVSVSDVHGYLPAARSALLTLADHSDYDPVVVADDAGRLRWAGNDYVLVFNGDLVDRGPHNEGTIEMVARLLADAPTGRVRVTLGNHEMGIMLPDRFGWDGWYSTGLSGDERRGFLERIAEGHVVAAYEGHRVTFAHAGRPDPYEVATVNDALVSAAGTLAEAVGSPHDATVQQEVVDGYPAVLGLGGRTGRGPGAGIAWLDFAHMPADAPPQVVGHTRHDEPTRKGAVVCQNVIRNTLGQEGGEAVVVETPEDLRALVRGSDGSVAERAFSLP